MRIVSLVPSLTWSVAALGRGDHLVGATDYCMRGVPAGSRRVGGTKYPSVEAVLALSPDLVLANREENRREDVDRLRSAGLDVLVTFPRTVPEVAAMLRQLGDRLDAPAAGGRLADAVGEAMQRAMSARPSPAVPVLTLVWRKPWMAVGTGTYVDDLLERCGFVNVAAGLPGRYPRLDAQHGLTPSAVLLPSEPYPFGPGDLDAVGGLVGPVAHRFVDGQLLTWHGPDTVGALDIFSALAAELATTRAGDGDAGG